VAIKRQLFKQVTKVLDAITIHNKFLEKSKHHAKVQFEVTVKLKDERK